MRSLRLGMHVGTAALLVGVSSACSVLGGDDTDPPSGVADDLAAALSGHSLADVPLVDDADRAAFADLVAPLEEVPVAVEVTSVDEVEGTGDEPGSATATLAWRWQLTDAAPWEYDTTVALVPAGTGWQVDWAPDALAPDLADGDTLGLRTVPPVRGDITGADGAVLVTERPVLRYGLDKTKVEGPQVARSARRIARVLDVDVASYVERAEAMGAEAFVEALVLREDDALDVLPGFAKIRGALAVRDTMPLAPTREFAAALLGRVGPATAEVVEASEGRIVAGDEVGLSGLQARYDEQLRGVPGAVRRRPRRRRPAAHPRRGPGHRRGRPRDHPRPGAAAEGRGRAGHPRRGCAGGGPRGDPAVRRRGPGERQRCRGGGRRPRHDGAVRPRLDVQGRHVARAAAQRDGGGRRRVVPRHDGRRRPVVQELRRLPGLRARRHHPRPRPSPSPATPPSSATPTASADGDLAAAAQALGLGTDHDLGFPVYFGQVPPPETETGAAADMIGQGTVLASPFAMATVAASVRGRPGRAAGAAAGPPGRAGARPTVPLTGPESGTLRGLMRAVVTTGSGRFLQDVPGEVGAKTGTAEYGEPDASGALPTHAWMIATRGDLAVAVFVETGVSGSQTAGPVLEAFLR